MATTIRYIKGKSQHKLLVWACLICMALCQTGFSQASFNAAEYFFDTDPGIGSGTPISVALSADSVSISENISTTGLSEGAHTLFIRTRTDGVKWSLSEGRTFWIKTSIVYAEYFIDTDPGVGSGTPLSITGSEDSIAFSGGITIPMLSGGFHNLFIRTRDNLGNWSLYEGKPFYVNSSATYEAAEWFIDTDPGIGNGIPLALSGLDSATFTGGITVPPLSGGWHNLFVRAKVLGGAWSLYEGKPFYVNSGNLIDYAEYFLDTDPGMGSATPISITAGLDSVTVSTGITLPVNTPAGNHYLYIRTRTTDGKWSHYAGNPIYVKNSITAAEYFYDNDPGIGNGTPLSVTASEDSVTINATALSIACLDSGTHYLFIRTKDAAGNWSLYEHDTLFINQPAPQISASGPSAICAGDSTILSTNTGTGCSYQWYLNNVAIPSATAHTYTANVGGDYKLVMTTNGINYTSNTITITIGGGGPPPSISASGPTTFCAGGSVDLTALPNGSQAFLWSTGATTQSITVNSSGNYFCTVTDNAGCDAPASITVTVHANPTPNILPATVTICNGSSATLTVSGGSGYSWSNGANSAGTSVSPATATTYTVTVTDANNCTASASRLVNVNPTPSVTAANTGPYCLGGTIQLNVGGAVSYSWSGVNGFSSLQQNPTRAAITANAGVYTVTGTDANNCTASATTTVVVNGSPASITPSGATTFCDGGSVDLTANTGVSWSWSNGAVSQTISVTGTGSYTVTVTDANACTSSAAQSVTVLANPIASANHSTPVCEGGSVTLSSAGGNSYSWSGPSFSSALQNPAINSLSAAMHNGNYTVTVTAANGCTASASTNITVSTLPVASASSNSPVCQWTTILFNSSGGTTYTWSGPNSFSSNAQNPWRMATAADAGAYNVTVTNANGCSASASTNVVVNVASAWITPSGPTTFCSPGSVTLSANAGSSYSWNTGATTQDITVSASGTFSVSVTAANGCSSVAGGFPVTVNPTPTVNASNTGPYCVGYNILLNASGTNVQSYSWSGMNGFNAATQNATVNNSVAASFGAYNVTATSSAGCTATATTTVSSNGNAPILSYSGSAEFTSHIVDPLMASPYSNFRFEVKYTDADGNLPAASYPRLIMDYEANGNFTDPNDRLFIMQQADPADVDVTDGKIYFYVATGLPVGLNYQTRIVANDNSASNCTTTFGPFSEPDVLDDADIFIFANDITFSDNHPDTSAPLQVCATIHNESDYPALNFVVKLKNQYDTLANYGDVTVPFLAAHSTTTVCWNITTPSTPSWNPMQVIVDYTNVINEPNELDNQAIRPFVCGNFILPGDIKLTAQVSPQTSYAVANNWLGISGRATYRNTAVPLQDPSVAGATVSFFIPSTGATYSTYTNSQGYYNLSFLAPVTPGVYQVQGTVTDFTLDGDTTAPFALNTPPCLPDLSPYFNLPTATIVAGQSISGVQYQITNSGCGNVGINTLSTWTCSGATTPSGNSTTSAPFNAGTTQYFNFPILTFPTAGNYSLCLNADAGNGVLETNENNQFCRGITVLPACADLTAGVQYLASSYQQCQQAGFSFSTANIGGHAAGTTSFARLVIKHNGNIEAVYHQQIQNLAAQNGTSFSYTHSFAQTGTYQLIFSVDTTNIISECNETNNSITVYTSSNACVYKPDLTVEGCSSFNITPTDPLTSPTVGVTAVIRNGGNATANGPFVVRFNLVGNVIDHVFGGNLAAGASATINLSFPTPAAPGGNLIVTADATDAVNSEWSETNNSTTVSACHDFWLGNDCIYTIGNDFWEKNQVLNQPFNMGVWLRSGGLYKASLVKTKFEISGPGLNPGWNDLGFATNTNVSNACGCPVLAQLPTPFACPATGTYTVRMTADYDAQYAECNEANNEFVVSFTCTNLPDYRTLSQYIAPSLLNPEPNQPISIAISYDNIGASNIGDSMEIKLLIDDVAVDSTRDKTLAQGDHWTTLMPNTWSSPIVGVHILRAIVDANNEIAEGIEGSNNEATRAIIVGQSPNLRFTHITPSNATPALGNVITFNVTIANDGDQDATSTILFKYVNDNGDTVQFHAINNGNFPNNDSVSFSFSWTVADASTFIFGYIVNTTPGEYLYDDNTAYTQLGALNISFSSTPETCISASNGTLTANVSGGVPPYSFIWSNGGGSTGITAGSGNYTVTVIDADGNIGIGGGTITTIPDLTYPIIGNMPANITYNATNGICPATITWAAPLASDNCGIDSFYSNKQPGSSFSSGTTTVTYTAKDKAGNTTTASFTVTVHALPLVYAGPDATVCGSGTLNALAAQWGIGAWSVATGTANFTNAASEVSTVSNLSPGLNSLVWTITNGTCGSAKDTVVITQPLEVCGNGIDDDCDGLTDEGCFAPNVVWSGGVSNDWSNPLNWTPNVVPSGCATDVVIPDAPNDPVISAPINVGDVTINANAQLTINSTLNICGDWIGGTGTNALVNGSGKLVFNGSTQQLIGGKTLINKVLINNASGVQLQNASATLEIAEALELKSGNLAAGTGNIVLKSDASNTAYLDNFSTGYTGTYSGSITVERYISNTNDGYRNISSPVVATVAQLADDMPIFGQNNVNCWYSYNPYPNVQIYTESANNNLSTPSGNYYTGWISKTGLTNPMGTMQGFSLRTYHGAPFVIDIKGTPNNGAQSRSITHTVSATSADDGWNFVGNPYTSPIDWNDVKAMNSGIDGSYYAFNTTGEYSGNYSSYNGVTGTNGGTRNIASMQGFFVKKTAAGSQSFVMNNTVREAETNTVFHKGAALSNEVRLELSGNGNTDEIVFYTDPGSTWGFDAEQDALKMPAGSTVYISYKQLGKEYAINTVQQLTATTELRLVLWVRDAGIYTLNATELNLYGLKAYLKDNKTGALTPLSTSGSGVKLKLRSGYKYDMDYSIVFESTEVGKTTETESANQKTEQDLRIYSYNSFVVVEKATDLPAIITITNLLGQTVKEVNTTSRRTEIEMDTGNEWYAVVKVKEANATKTNKVLIK